MEESAVPLLEIPEAQETDSVMVTAAADSQAVTQVYKEIVSEHRYFGGCDDY